MPSPIRQPLQPHDRACAQVVQGCEQVRFALATIAQQYDGTRLARAGSFDGFQKIERGVGDLQKFVGRDLQRPRLRLIREVNRRSLELLPTELFPQLQVEHWTLVIASENNAV